MQLYWRNRFCNSKDIIRYLSAEMELASHEWLRMQQGHAHSIGMFKNFQNRAKFQWMRFIMLLISFYNPQSTAH